MNDILLYELINTIDIILSPYVIIPSLSITIFLWIILLSKELNFNKNINIKLILKNTLIAFLSTGISIFLLIFFLTERYIPNQNIDFISSLSNNKNTNKEVFVYNFIYQKIFLNPNKIERRTFLRYINKKDKNKISFNYFFYSLEKSKKKL